jgi:hypothetical protein
LILEKSVLGFTVSGVVFAPFAASAISGRNPVTLWRSEDDKSESAACCFHVAFALPISEGSTPLAVAASNAAFAPVRLRPFSLGACRTSQGLHPTNPATPVQC